jgi:hypothetical protein
MISEILEHQWIFDMPKIFEEILEDQSKDLVKRILVIDPPEERLSTADLLQHPCLDFLPMENSNDLV